MKQDTSTDHFFNITNRVYGNVSLGDNTPWCEPKTKKGIELLVNPIKGKHSEKKQFGGCLKYQKCSLIPEKIKFKEISQLSESEKEVLLSHGCYRVTTSKATQEGDVKSDGKSNWDVNYLDSRKNDPENAEWIGNPFGLRTKTANPSGKFNGKEWLKHRDLNPCKIGGCITPEMERDFEFSNNQNNKESSKWDDNKACPFYYRHTSEALDHAEKNSYRFSQCYITLAPFREFMAKQGVLVIAPVFRGSLSVIGGQHWYSFYSGFPVLQFIPRINFNDESVEDKIPFQLRWLATTYARQQPDQALRKRLPLDNMFSLIEKNKYLSGWEREQNFLSVSEGFASAFLIQWIVLRRLSFKEIKNSAEFEKTPFVYEKAGENAISTKLKDVGFNVEGLFLLIRDGENVVRESTFTQDLELTGIINRSNTGQITLTERYKYLESWLVNSIMSVRKDFEQTSFEFLAYQWLTHSTTEIERLKSLTKPEDKIECLLSILLKSIIKPKTSELLQSNLFLEVSPEKLTDFEDEFNKLFFLNPPLHIIVRSYMSVPIRWVLYPTKFAYIGSEPRVLSAIVLLLHDRIDSPTYGGKWIDFISKESLPLISLINSIEEGNVREELVRKGKLESDYNEMVFAVQHAVKTVTNTLQSKTHESLTPKDLSSITTLLKGLQYFFGTNVSFDLKSESPSTTINAVNVVAEIVDHVNHFNKKGSAFIAIGRLEKSARIKIWPLTNFYTSELSDSHKVSKIAQNDFAFVVGFILLERQSYEAVLNGYCDNGSFVLEIITGRFKQDEIGIIKEDSEINKYPKGRGFWSGFKLLRRIGSGYQEVLNYGNTGIMRIRFELILQE